jgi:hypothetical protein
MEWARILAYISGTVDQELLLRNGYLAAENRILRAQVKGAPKALGRGANEARRDWLSTGPQGPLSRCTYRGSDSLSVQALDSWIAGVGEDECNI